MSENSRYQKAVLVASSHNSAFDGLHSIKVEHQKSVENSKHSTSMQNDVTEMVDQILKLHDPSNSSIETVNASTQAIIIANLD